MRAVRYLYTTALSLLRHNTSRNWFGFSIDGSGSSKKFSHVDCRMEMQFEIVIAKM